MCNTKFTTIAESKNVQQYLASVMRSFRSSHFLGNMVAINTLENFNGFLEIQMHCSNI